MPQKLSSTLIIHRQALPGDIHFNMIEVKGGQFMMGSESEDANSRERPVHEVELATFYMGQFPVTQKLWEAVMGKNPSRFQGENRPVEGISWYDSVEFCNRLSEMQNLDSVYEINKTQTDRNNQSRLDKLKWTVIVKKNANGYRLPMEAQWEYAARGGIYSKGYTYSGSEDIDRSGWYWENSRRETQPTDLSIPNELGIHGMSGNVYEWCQDWYDDSYYLECQQKGVVKNPQGSNSGSLRVLRGGSWFHFSSNCRIAYRDILAPYNRYFRIGFRLARTEW